MTCEEFLHEILQPGETIVFSGRRGHGKTATAISLVQHAMEHDYGHKHVECVTNVNFGRVIKKGKMPIEAYPDGIHHEDTLSGTMRCIGDIIREHGSGNCLIIWLLDEAQNFMMADQNGSKENMALTKYLGNARKFDVCNLFLTPTMNNLTPRVRCFPTGEAKSGYCSCQMYKDKIEARGIVGDRVDPRSITFVRTGPEQDYTPMFISTTPWTYGIYDGKVPEGSYGYDTKSTATFSIGENEYGIPFAFEKFIRATSGGLSHELPGKISDFFSKWDEEGVTDEDGEALPGEDLKRIHISDQCRRIARMRDMGIKWREIGMIEDEPPTTLKSRFKVYSSKMENSSKTDEDEEDSKDTGGYIQPYKGEGGPGPAASSGEAAP